VFSNVPRITMTTETFTRTRSPYLISSDKTLLSLPAINDAFDSEALYWCTPVETSTLKTLIDNSFCLGLYRETASNKTQPLATAPKPEQIGFARLVTDYATMAYISDVYVVQEEQGKGLGKWLIQSINEVLGGMGKLRRALLFTEPGRTEEFYQKELGMTRLAVAENGLVIMHKLGDGATARLRE